MMSKDFTTISTKISKSDKQKLVYIANAFNMTFYELLQSLLLSLVRYFDRDTIITYEHETMLNAFCNVLFSLNKDTFSPLALKSRDDRKIDKVFAFVEQKNKCDNQLMEIKKQENGQITENYNYENMLIEFLASLDKDILHALEREKKSRGYFSLLQTLHEIVLERCIKPKENIKTEIESMFTDVRTQYGEKMNYDIHYNRKHNFFGSAIMPVKKSLKV